MSKQETKDKIISTCEWNPEPREFWIDDILSIIRPYQRMAYMNYQDTESFIDRTIHVVEYSALEAANEKTKELQAKYDKCIEAFNESQEGFLLVGSDTWRDHWSTWRHAHWWTLKYLAGSGDGWKNTDDILDGAAIEYTHTCFSKFNDIELANMQYLLTKDSFKGGARYQYEKDQLQIAALKLELETMRGHHGAKVVEILKVHKENEKLEAELVHEKRQHAESQSGFCDSPTFKSMYKEITTLTKTLNLIITISRSWVMSEDTARIEKPIHDKYRDIASTALDGLKNEK